MNKQKIVLFGASLGGKRAFRALQKECEIIAFVDNDEKKQGTKFMGVPVMAPADLSRLEYDKIYISSMYDGEIVYQLKQNNGILPGKITLVGHDILNGDEEVPWGCLSIIATTIALALWGVYELIF